MLTRYEQAIKRLSTKEITWKFVENKELVGIATYSICSPQYVNQFLKSPNGLICVFTGLDQKSRFVMDCGSPEDLVLVQKWLDPFSGFKCIGIGIMDEARISCIAESVAEVNESYEVKPEDLTFILRFIMQPITKNPTHLNSILENLRTVYEKKSDVFNEKMASFGFRVQGFDGEKLNINIYDIYLFKLNLKRLQTIRDMLSLLVNEQQQFKAKFLRFFFEDYKQKKIIFWSNVISYFKTTDDCPSLLQAFNIQYDRLSETQRQDVLVGTHSRSRELLETLLVDLQMRRDVRNTVHYSAANYSTTANKI